MVSELPPPLDVVPFSLIDEAYHLLDIEAAPWSIQLETRVSGSLDEDRLRSALARALALHPMARARKVASPSTAHRDMWAFPPAPDIDPLRVVDCPDEIALGVARSELLSVAVPLSQSPPLRVSLARHPDGDVLMMNVNHAAMDGFGAVRVLQSIAHAYAGRPDPTPPVAFDEARDLPARLARVAEARVVARRWLALAVGLRHLVAPPARLAKDGATDEIGYGFCQVSLPPETTEAFVEGDRRGTVNDALVAALNLAIARWNAEHGARCRRVVVILPVNLRPPQWRQDIVGNFSLTARVSTHRRDRRTAATALDAVTSQTRRKKSSGIGTSLLAALGHTALLPLWAKRGIVGLLPITGNRLIDTAAVSNLGRLADVPSFGTGAGDTREVLFSGPARMPLGLVVGAVTAGGRLHLSFRYCHRLFGPAAAERFVETYLAALSEVVRLAGPGLQCR